MSILCVWSPFQIRDKTKIVKVHKFMESWYMLDQESLISNYWDSCGIDSKYVSFSPHEARVSWFSIQGKKIIIIKAIQGLAFQDFWRAVWCKQTTGDFQVSSKHQLRIIVHVYKDLVIKVKLLNPVDIDLLEWIFKWVLEVMSGCSHFIEFACIRFYGFEAVYSHVSRYSGDSNMEWGRGVHPPAGPHPSVETD